MRLSSVGSPWNNLYCGLLNSPESVFIFIHGTFANAESSLLSLRSRPENYDSWKIRRRVGANVREIQIQSYEHSSFGLTNRGNLRIGYASQLLIEDRHCIVLNRA